MLSRKGRSTTFGLFSAIVILFFSLLALASALLLRGNYAAQRRLVIASYLDLERVIVERTASAAELWFRTRMGEASIDEIEDEVFREFVDPIKVLRSGDAWIYNREYVIYDKSSDFPAEYRGKPIDQIFRMQAPLGASHYDELVDGVLSAGSGEGWYVWLPEKGREWAAWRSFAIGGSTWTLGLSTPEKEIFEYYGVDDAERSARLFWFASVLVLAACAAALILWFRRRQLLAEALTAAKLEAEAANRAKSDFLATISHEIRTPMNGVLGYLDLLSLDPGEDERREYLSVARANARGLIQIVNDLLDFSKLEKGKVELEIVSFDPVEVARDAVRLLAPQASRKSIALGFDPCAPCPCRGDPLRFKQVLVNLLGNAVKFTPEGGKVGLFLSSSPDAGRHRLQVEVADTGIGIPRERQERIFEAFSQGDASIAGRFGGTGLGLSISARIARLMGGTISVESEPGKGSRFRFEVALPAADPAELDALAEPGARAIGESVALPSRVLVAEDTRDSRLLLVRMLEKLGCSAGEAVDGLQALAAFKTGRYDAAILDGYMPGMNGDEVARRIRDYESSSGLPRTPILALSARATEAEKAAFLAAGVDAFLSKPLSLEALVSALRSVVPKDARDAGDRPEGEGGREGERGDEAIDAGAFRARCGGNKALVLEILGVFMAEAPGRRERIAAALAGRDLGALRDVAHSLKGSSGSLCAKELFEASRALEEACRKAAAGGKDAVGTEACRGLESLAEALLAALDRGVESARSILG